MDLRKRRSQEKLQNALALHLQTKTIDEITIGELTETAGVSRQTFYSNFDSKQSILLSRLDQLFVISKLKYDEQTEDQGLSRTEYVEVAIKCLLFECDKQKALMRAAFTGQAGIQCLSLLKEFVSSIISSRILLQFNYDIPKSKLEIISEFYSGGIIGAIQGWLLDDEYSKSIDMVAKQVGILIPHGLDGLFHKRD